MVVGVSFVGEIPKRPTIYIFLFEAATVGGDCPPDRIGQSEAPTVHEPLSGRLQQSSLDLVKLIF